MRAEEMEGTAGSEKRMGAKWEVWARAVWDGCAWSQTASNHQERKLL